MRGFNAPSCAFRDTAPRPLLAQTCRGLLHPLAIKSLPLHNPEQLGCGKSPLISPSMLVRAAHPLPFTKAKTPEAGVPSPLVSRWGEAHKHAHAQKIAVGTPRQLEKYFRNLEALSAALNRELRGKSPLAQSGVGQDCA